MDIRDFRVRGHYAGCRLVSGVDSPFLSRSEHASTLPGYSPPVVEYDATGPMGEVTRTLVARDIDLPFLCQDDFEQARQYLALLLRAHDGDSDAGRTLSSLEQARVAGAARPPHPQPLDETRFVVPSTSARIHSEQLVSHKGSILLRLARLGYPVPEFVILTSEAYLDRALHLEDHLSAAARQLAVLTLQQLGDAEKPLVLAVRCAMPLYIPGIMRTFLNAGVTERTLSGVERIYGVVPARRMFLNTLQNLCGSLDPHNAPLADAVPSGLPPDEVDRAIDRLSAVVARRDRRLLEDAFAQVAFFVEQAYKYFEENQDLLAALSRDADHHPCIILQKMICTVRHPSAYAGVIFSRHSQTGEGTELQAAHDVFGDDIMTGTTECEATAFNDREDVRERFPAVYHFAPHLPDLEREFESPVTIEFAVEATGRCQWFALLQLNESGLAGRAAMVSVTDMHQAGTISRRRVSELIRPYHIRQLMSDTIDPEEIERLDAFCGGIALLPRGAVAARLYFTDEAALQAKRRGENVCLCKRTFHPTDTVVMREVDAILSLTSAAIHVITICQSLGMPALLSLERDHVSLEADTRLVNRSGATLEAGDWITLSSRRKVLYQGKATFKPARLLRYMRGEQVHIDEAEQAGFARLAYAYRYYQRLTGDRKVDQISTLGDVIRLVNLELRTERDQARQLVNGWFDDREALYVDGVLESDMGDHLSQHSVFGLLTLQRKIRFFKRALARCVEKAASGYAAGAFMLGRFLASRYPVAFWKSFDPLETGLLVNEWVLFEKYMQVLSDVGERRIFRARRQILTEGLHDLTLNTQSARVLIPLKLSAPRLEAVRAALPAWSDPQTAKVLELLAQPYGAFYDFTARWSVGELERICQDEGLPVPAPEDI